MSVRAAVSVLAAVAQLALPATAAAPDRSLRPVPRHAATSGADATVRPMARPDAPSGGTAGAVHPKQRPIPTRAAALLTGPERAASLGPETSLLPWARPDSVVQQALFGRRKLRKGAVCGDIGIQGERIGRVPGKIKGCGVADAVRVRSVSGVRLSQPSVMDCTTAKALKRWVDNGVRLAFRPEGKVVELKVAAHYACRTRNNKRGARISEHGKGKAIDISAFVFRDGKTITVAEGWKGRQSTRSMLQRAWKTACGPFGTVLGPNADRYHWNHFHLDTARYRGGPYCH